MAGRAARGFTLIELLVVIIVAAILASLVLPAWLRARRNDRLRECSANLAGLWRKRTESGLAGGPPGPAYWSGILPPGSPLLACPVKGGPAAEGCDYRGPAGDAERLAGTDVLGADRPGNHSGSGPDGGGNVLLKSGEVQTVAPLDPLWKEAAEKTR